MKPPRYCPECYGQNYAHFGNCPETPDAPEEVEAPNADISSDLLFPVPEVLSPRLAWIKRNEVLTFHTHEKDDRWFAAFNRYEFPFESAADFFCQETGKHGDSRCGQRKTMQSPGWQSKPA